MVFPISLARPALLVDGLKLSVRGTGVDRPQSSIPVAVETSATDQIERLVSTLVDRLLASARSGRSEVSQSTQLSIDHTLSQISALVGAPLRLGGAKHARIERVNSDQIVDVEVLRLPPNSSAEFLGAVTHTTAPARVVVDNVDQLLREGGKLRLSANRDSSINVRPGSSLTALQRRINARRLGVVARSRNGRLELSTSSDGSERTV